MQTTLIGLAVIAAVVIYIVMIYNKLIALRNHFKNGFSQIDVQRRHDLIPNLIEATKAYLDHERNTLTSSTSAEHARQLYCEAMAGFFDGKAEEVPESGKMSVLNLRDALSQLNQLSPLLKPAIIDACGHCVLSDRQVSPREYDILRLVADQLDCPMPPLAYTR